VDTDLITTFVVIAIAAVVALGGAIWRKAKRSGARSWPMSQGQIEFGTVVERDVRYVTYYIAQMSYSYAVEGDYYSGFYEKAFLRQESAQKFTDELKGKPAFVRHKPNSPATSVILREDQQSVWPLEV
jgi:hypothetical protein